MTVAHLKERMDAGFNDQRVRIEAGFSSMNDKLNAILFALRAKDDHQQEILNEHEERLKDLEAWRRTPQDIDR